MIETEGMITVAEAARRLDRSIEQVRRKLREGKLRGQRVGNQWFVEEGGIVESETDSAFLVPRELLERIDRNREAIYQRSGMVDVKSLLEEVRENDF